MPVVYLPEDKRWEKLGEGLGAIGGALYQRWQMADAYKDVAEMMKDPNISQADLPGQVYAKHGQYGQLALRQITDQQTKQQALQKGLADIGLDKARTDYINKQIWELGQKTPAEVAHMQAQTTLLGAQAVTEAERPPLVRAEAGTEAERAPLVRAQTGAETARTGLIGAQTGLTQEEQKTMSLKSPEELRQLQIKNAILGTSGMTEAAAKAEEASTDAATKKLQLERLQRLMISPTKFSGTDIDSMLDAVGVTDPGTRDTLKIGYLNDLNSLDPNAAAKAGKHFTDEVMKLKTQESASRIRTSEPKQTPQPQLESAARASEAAFSANEFRQAFEAGGYKESGFFNSGPAKALLEKIGIGTGDQNIVAMHSANVQQRADFAKQQGGFGGEWAVRLGADVTPRLTESPMSQIVQLGEELGRLKAKLQTERMGLTPQQSKAPLDKAINEVDETFQWAHSLKSTVVAQGTPREKTITLFAGNQVDPITFEPMIRGDQSYTDAKGTSVPGYKIIAAAMNNPAWLARGWGPAEFLAKLQGKPGYDLPTGQ